MASIGDLVRDNPFYTDYYKTLVPEEIFAEQISPEALQRALVQQTCIEIAKKVTLIALVVIPSIYVVGGVAIGSTILAGMIGAIGSEIGSADLNIFRVIHFQSNLLAAIPKDKQNTNIFITQLGVDTAIKTVFVATLLLAPAKVASVFGYIGICYAAYSLTK